MLCSGEAAAQIAEVARTHRFDLIIMPTHAGRFRRMLLGSTTAKVLNDAECPVMTTQHAESLILQPLGHRVWVCAIGLSQGSERVVRLASSAAVAVGAKLHVIHATHELGEKDARRGLDELLATVGCGAEVDIVFGPVKDALLAAVCRSGADALIVGRAPRTGALGRLGDLTYSLVRDSPFPVISV
jgi:nucleotide-binding universal stress UspA family protein